MKLKLMSMNKNKKNKDFTIIPNALLKHGLELGLNDADKMTYATVKMYQWGNNPPYPSSGTIAKLRGISKRNVQMSSIKMQELGYLKRPLGGRKPVWNFEALDKILNAITAGNSSLLEDAKERVHEYLTAKETTLLEQEKKKSTVQNLTINSANNDKLTVPFSAPEEDTKKKTKKKEKEIDKEKENNKELNFNYLLKEEKKYMDAWRGMDLNERFKLDTEAKQLVNFGSPVAWNGSESPQLNKLRVEALKLRQNE